MGQTPHRKLLDLRFFEEHVLTDHRVVLLLFKFPNALCTLLVGGVVVAVPAVETSLMSSRMTKPQYSLKAGAAVISASACVQRKNLAAGVLVGLLMGGLTGCSSEPEPEPEPTRRYTWRAITGVSMGGGASAMLGLKYPQEFDFIGIMGGPLVDLSGFSRMIERHWLGGFCSLERLEELMAQGDDLDNVGAFCGLYTEQPNPSVLAEAPVAPAEAYPAGAAPILEAASDFNNRWRGLRVVAAAASTATG